MFKTKELNYYYILVKIPVRRFLGLRGTSIGDV